MKLISGGVGDNSGVMADRCTQGSRCETTEIGSSNNFSA